MGRQLQNRLEAHLLAWGDAKAMIDRHGDMAQREAGSEGARSDRPRWPKNAPALAAGSSDHRVEDRRGHYRQRPSQTRSPASYDGQEQSTRLAQRAAIARFAAGEGYEIVAS
jgi:hypothetical protein